jgi:hypothetical protein
MIVEFLGILLNIKDVEKLQTNLDRLGDWVKGNEMKINPN